MKLLDDEHAEVIKHLKNIKDIFDEMDELGLGGPDFAVFYLTLRLIPMIEETFK
ncbi:hypothetical protein LCGC14_2585520 [marine sediment metagenome]|uniref:Uncharacterized protein n=1 Tax=marine sediment metagenome TaxID=412755 RepID=A0A0F9AD23_9ZZZZ